MIALASLLLAQLVVPSGVGLTADQKIAILANTAATGSTEPMTIFEDPAIRAEMKRVGLDAGCPVITAITRDSSRRSHEAMLPFAEQAVRDTIPASVTEELRLVSFSVGRASGYASRVRARFRQLAAEPLAQSHREASAEITARLSQLGGFQPTAETAPALAPVFQNSFGAPPEKAWDSAPLMAIACFQRTAPKDGSIRIESGGKTFPEGVDP